MKLMLCKSIQTTQNDFSLSITNSSAVWPEDAKKVSFWAHLQVQERFQCLLQNSWKINTGDERFDEREEPNWMFYHIFHDLHGRLADIFSAFSGFVVGPACYVEFGTSDPTSFRAFSWHFVLRHCFSTEKPSNFIVWLCFQLQLITLIAFPIKSESFISRHLRTKVKPVCFQSHFPWEREGWLVVSEANCKLFLFGWKRKFLSALCDAPNSLPCKIDTTCGWDWMNSEGAIAKEPVPSGAQHGRPINQC